jgi:phosphoribosylglycinamide formyltransferase-1
MYGERVHQAVLAAGDEVSGCTVHFVNTVYDDGEIILQTEVPVINGDTVETLSARVLEAEHETYAEALKQAIEQRHVRN